MEYANENWIKVYTRDTAGWLDMSWQARGISLDLSRKAEKTTGEIPLGRKGLRALASLLRATWEEIEPFISELLEEGRLIYDQDRQVVIDRDHSLRQGVVATAAERKRRQRETASLDVTRGHAESRDVTPGHAESLKKERKKETEKERETHAHEDSPTAPPEPGPEPTAMPEWAAKTIDAIATANLMTAAELDGVNAWGKFTAKADDEARPISEPRFRGFMSSWAASVKQRRSELAARNAAQAKQLVVVEQSKKRHQQRGMSPPARARPEDDVTEPLSADELAAPLRALMGAGP